MQLRSQNLNPNLNYQDTEVAEFVTTIKSVLQNGKPPPITQAHANMCIKPFHAMRGDEKAIRVMRSLPPLNVQKTNEIVKGIEKLVQLESIYTCMQSVNTVCVVSRADMPKLHTMLTAWVTPVSNAHKARHKTIAQWICSRLDNADDAKCVLNVFG